MSKPVQLVISLVAAAAILGILFIIFNALQDADVPMPTEESNTSDVSEELDVTQGTSSRGPRVIFETSKGDIVLELFEEEMPDTVGNFITLVTSGFYDGTRFHRVIPGFMIQGGDPLTKETSLQDRWGTGGPGYTIPDEFGEGLSNVRGTIAMANTGQPNSGGSQFFINVADNVFLDFDTEPLASKHPVFGRVVEGMGVVDAILEVPTEGSDRPIEDIIIERARVED